MSTRTITITETRPVVRFNFDPEGDDEPPSDDEGGEDTRDASGLLPCEKIIHVYGEFSIMSKVKGTLKGSDKSTYYLYKLKNVDAVIAMVKKSIDKNEFKIYEPYFFWNKTPSAEPVLMINKKQNIQNGKQVIFVRCANNSLHMLPSVKLLKPQNIVALNRFASEFSHEYYEKAKKMKASKSGRKGVSWLDSRVMKYAMTEHEAMNKAVTASTSKTTKTTKASVAATVPPPKGDARDANAMLRHLNFSREKRDAKNKVAILDACHVPTSTCRSTLKEACNDSNMRYPEVINAIHNYGKRVTNTNNPNVTWEEVCFTNNNSFGKGKGRKLGRRSATGSANAN